MQFPAPILPTLQLTPHPANAPLIIHPLFLFGKPIQFPNLTYLQLRYLNFRLKFLNRDILQILFSLCYHLILSMKLA